MPLALPGVIAGSIFTFSLTLGDYIIPQIIGSSRLFIGQAVYSHQGTAGNIPLAAAFAVVPIVIMGCLPVAGETRGSLRCALTSRRHRTLKIAAGAGLLFLHLPILLIFVYAFTTEERSYQWPPPGFTTKWLAVTWNRPDIWDALGLSVKVASISTLIALLLGTLCAAAVSRSKFFGREVISLMVILPIALPGIVTGIALAFGFQPVGYSVFDLDHHPRARHVLRGGGVQQRGGALSAQLGLVDRGVDGSGRRRLSRRCATWFCRTSRRRCSPAACSPSRCPSTKSSSLPSLPVSNRRCRSGCWKSWYDRASARSTNVVAMVVVLATFLPILGAFYLTRDGDQIAGSGK